MSYDLKKFIPGEVVDESKLMRIFSTDNDSEHLCAIWDKVCTKLVKEVTPDVKIIDYPDITFDNSLVPICEVFNAIKPMIGEGGVHCSVKFFSDLLKAALQATRGNTNPLRALRFPLDQGDQIIQGGAEIDFFESDNDPIKVEFSKWLISRFKSWVLKFSVEDLIKAEEDAATKAAEAETKKAGENVKTKINDAANDFDKACDDAMRDFRDSYKKRITEIITFPSIIEYAFGLLKEDDSLKHEQLPVAIDALAYFLALPNEVRYALARLTPRSGLVMACGKEDNVAGATQQERIDFIKKNHVRDGQTPSEEIKAIVASPPFEKSIGKHIMAPQSNKKNKISIIMHDPTQTGPGCVIMNDRMIPAGHKYVIPSKYYMEAQALSNVFVSIEKYNIMDDPKKLLLNNLYTDNKMIEPPKPIWSRYSITFESKKSDTRLFPDVTGVKIYSMRAEKRRSTTTDMVVDAKVGYVPTLAYGAERFGVYSVLKATTEGRKLLEKFEVAATAKIEKANQELIDNYFLSIKIGLDLLVQKADKDKYVTYVRRFGSPNTVQSFWLHEYRPKILPSLASHQGFRFNLQGELAFGGTAIGGVLKLLDQLEGRENLTYVVLCAHDLATKAGVKIAYSDFVSGQNLNGELVGLTQAEGTTSAERLPVLYEYVIPSTNLDYDRPDGSKISIKETCASRSKNSIKITPKHGNVLIDLFIPGRLYNPQNEEKKNMGEEFRGKKLLYDSTDTVNVYTPEELQKFDGFMVYFSLADLRRNEKDKSKFDSLFATHNCWYAPTSIMHYYGVYLLGVRDATGSVPKVLKNYAQASYILNTHINLKSIALIETFKKMLADPIEVYSRGPKNLYTLPYVQKLAKTVGGIDAYRELFQADNERDDMPSVEKMYEYADESDSVGATWMDFDSIGAE